MRSAALSAIPKTAYTTMLLITVFTFMASYTSAQQRKTIRKENTTINAKNRHSQITATSWLKADLQAITLNKHFISAPVIQDSLISIPPFQPAATRAGGLVCGVAGVLIILQPDPWKPVSPLSLFDFL
ncbi:hypothetical protein [Chitinophaga pinensis]|uniref:Uncharacterized protein n=1 Tax=Chitinophaga pinensis (strain ATCC 43595 / DSM 2588 / LMG 13176 / NBRC 15968 / NCIMB 11800 / UQM 2034) TaxID=485918 RepID=A0A979GMM7_CHIPD|nr:hypothetical protein [Chitinophaga pinensis]ACU58627.1 hypothetical protein Cpin_1129 [Chitinophaga pinensis DSM 2588]